MIDALISIIDSIGPTCSAVAAIVCCVALKQADANTKLIKHMDAKLSANDLASGAVVGSAIFNLQFRYFVHECANERVATHCIIAVV